MVTAAAFSPSSGVALPISGVLGMLAMLGNQVWSTWGVPTGVFGGGRYAPLLAAAQLLHCNCRTGDDDVVIVVVVVYGVVVQWLYIVFSHVWHCS
jgi:hypothetical protein